jgi:hypothetical protein
MNELWTRAFPASLPRLARRSCFAALAALAAVTACGVAVAQSEEEIASARKRGAEHLKSKQRSDGSWEFAGHDVGITALCAVALIENGTPLTDSSVQRAYEFVRRSDSTDNLKNTYDLSLAITLLSRVGDRRDRGTIKKLAARLIAGQMDMGGWHYTCPGQELDSEKALREPSSLPKPKEGFGDNSCTQFAVLGLWMASRSGVNIERTLERVAARFAKYQVDDGGWGYVREAAGQRVGSSESMTSAGLYCLAVARASQIREFLKSGKKLESGEAPSKNLLDDRVFARGLKRTGEFAKGIGTGSARYYLWSLERIGVLLGMQKFGETDWYQKGADALVKSQREDGSWTQGTPGAGADQSGLADTSFALLFLRKANLGSDISRLLEGEHDDKFEIVGRTPVARFPTLEKAVEAAQAGETIRINGQGPYTLGHFELKKDITIQAGFGQAPIFKLIIGTNRLGIRLRPESDDNARDMFAVSGGNVTLEGLRLQVDPPDLKKPIPWRAITVGSGSLRLLNCTISDTTRQGSSAILLRAPGKLAIHNCLLFGGKAGVEIVPAGRQEVAFDSSVIFSSAGVAISPDAKGANNADISVSFSNAVVQAKEVLQCPKVNGSIDVTSDRSVFRADWIASTLLSAADKRDGRSWNGSFNLYDVKQWVGANGKPVGSIKDAKSWVAFWDKGEKEAYSRIAPFLGFQEVGNVSHDRSASDWQLDFPTDAPPVLVRSHVGINAYQTGTGQPFDQFRETIGYSEWVKQRATAAATESKPAASAGN